MDVFRIGLCALAILTSFACTALLFRAYVQKRARLLLWSSLCFTGLTLNNVVLFLDLIVFPEANLRLVRLVTALIGMLFLLYGFIWDTE
jgi:hypothetical protein